MARVFREEAARLTGYATRLLGDFAVAEEIVADTIVAAIAAWRRDGVPSRPAAWLTTAIKRRAVDHIRRDATYARKLRELDRAEARGESVDDRLRLIFTCCHPALSRDAQVALTLQAVLGFSTRQIAASFLVSENVIAKRLSRARQKISAAHIPYRVPATEELPTRLSAVLGVLYLMFNEGYLSSRPTVIFERNLAADAAWLAELLVGLMPMEPESLGLLALMHLHLARAQARFDGDRLVLLRDQDRTLWDRGAIDAAIAELVKATAMRRPGPYQVQAAIVACHAEATSWAETDWVQVLLLYDLLATFAPGPIVRLNRAIALGEVEGPISALAEVDALAEPLDGYHLLHATRAELLYRMGDLEQARVAELAALRRTENPAERRLLERRMAARWE